MQGLKKKSDAVAEVSYGKTAKDAENVEDKLGSITKAERCNRYLVDKEKIGKRKVMKLINKVAEKDWEIKKNAIFGVVELVGIWVSASMVGLSEVVAVVLVFPIVGYTLWHRDDLYKEWLEANKKLCAALQ